LKVADVTVSRYQSKKGVMDFAVGSEMLVVEVHTDEGLTGRGFTRARVTPHGSTGDLSAILIRRILKNAIIGENPLLIEQLWNRMYGGYGGVSRLGRQGIVLGCLAAIDFALWDLKGKALGVPVCDLLGGRRERIPTYANTAHQMSAEDLARQAARYVGEGHNAVKIRGSLTAVSLEEATERVRAVREAVGPDVKLMVDVNGTWNVETAIEQLKRWEPYDVYWLEEPVPPEQVDGYSRVRERSGSTLIVGGEQHAGPLEFRALMEGKAVDIIQPDAHTVGGITQWLKIADMARAFNLPISPHALQVIHIHLAAAFSDIMWIEYFLKDNPLHELLTRLFKKPLIRDERTDEGVFLLPPEDAGLGIELDEGVAEATLVKD
jgi:D-arabinonate dehydratase